MTENHSQINTPNEAKPGGLANTDEFATFDELDAMRTLIAGLELELRAAVYRIEALEVYIKDPGPWLNKPR